MIHIDGSHGEGGGQIVRTALALRPHFTLYWAPPGMTSPPFHLP